MNKELYMERKNRKRKMHNKKLNHIFIIGVIYDHYDRRNIEAVKLYDIQKKKVSVQSIKEVKKRLEAGEKILGVHLRYSLKKNMELVSQVVFENGAYNCKMTDILNGKGEVIESRNGVIIGIKETEKNDYFVVMNGNGEIYGLTKEEIVDKQLNGVTKRGLICLNSCQRII